MFTIKNVLKSLFSTKITNVISFLTVTVRKIKDEQINNACASMGISITGNNEIRLLTFMFTIKRRKKDEKSIDIIVMKQTNKQSKMEHN